MRKQVFTLRRVDGTKPAEARSIVALLQRHGREAELAVEVSGVKPQLRPERIRRPVNFSQPQEREPERRIQTFRILAAGLLLGDVLLSESQGSAERLLGVDAEALLGEKLSNQTGAVRRVFAKL